MCVLLTTAPSGNSGQKPPSLGGKLSRKEEGIQGGGGPHTSIRSVRRAKFDEAAACRRCRGGSSDWAPRLSPEKPSNTVRCIEMQCC